MRKHFTSIVILFLTINMLPAQTEVKSTIKSVQVYTRGAQIERAGSVQLQTGKNELSIKGLSANLDPNTIQINGTDFTILSVRHELDFIDNQNNAEKSTTLFKRRKKVMDSISLIDLELSILSKEITLLDKNMGIVGDQGIKNDDFQAAVGYFTKRFEEITRARHKLNRQKLVLIEERKAIDEQLSSQNQEEKKPSSSIFLVLNAKSGKKADLGISYAIREAGWFPAYDIRAIDTHSPLALIYKARVFQNSGVDWNNVKLKISSGDLESNGTAPQLSPYYLGDHRNYGYTGSAQSVSHVTGIVTDEEGEPLPQVTVLVKGTTLGVPTDAGGRYSLQLPAGNQTLVFRFLGYTTQEVPANRSMISMRMSPETQELGEAVVTAYGNSVTGALQGRVAGVQIRGASSIGQKYRGKKDESIPLGYEQINYQTTFVYDIDLPYDIPSSGKPEVVDIKTELLEADYLYSTSPKAVQSAFLVARIPDWTELNLLDGESNLYFENSFVGKSIIDTHIGTDTLEISMGMDEGIIVNRERKRDFEQQRFFSGKKREERHFEITVMNTKTKDISVSVYDQVPVSARDNIKINVLNTDGGKLNDKTGLVTWQLKLKPGEKRVLQLKYAVDYPKSEDLEIN
ncbi:MAG: DUF4139 domain-containing protein [Roseivirga sp.]|nr:DUF4139 domain-containing protein [Roseivirga sp.]